VLLGGRGLFVVAAAVPKENPPGAGAGAGVVVADVLLGGRGLVVVAAAVPKENPPGAGAGVVVADVLLGGRGLVVVAAAVPKVNPPGAGAGLVELTFDGAPNVKDGAEWSGAGVIVGAGAGVEEVPKVNPGVGEGDGVGGLAVVDIPRKRAGAEAESVDL